MTEAEPKTPAPPGTEPAGNSGPQTVDLNQDQGDRIGTVLMAVGIGLVAVILLDLAFKGRLLAPLFALLPAPRTATEEPGDAETRPAGE